MILSAQSIRGRCHAGLILPFHERGVSPGGMSFGLSACGYDIRICTTIQIRPGGFVLAASLERFVIPDDLCMRIVDKSTWARRGLFVQNTVAEPGWRGYLTLELTNNSVERISLVKGEPIAQVQFEILDYPTTQPYAGKYQNQEFGPQPARREVK